MLHRHTLLQSDKDGHKRDRGQFQEEVLKVLSKYEDWKKPATRAKGKIVVEELIKCPKCSSLQPKGSAFCLECGEKLV